MSGEKKYLLYKGSEMPHIGEMLNAYIVSNRIYKAALARAMNRNARTLLQYRKNHSVQAAILWEVSHALRHNFFADMAAALPPSFTSKGDGEPDIKDQRIAALEAEVLRLQQDKDLLLQLMQEFKRRE